MPDVFLGLFKKIYKMFKAVNGLADPLYPAILNGVFRQFYEKDLGLINTDFLAGIGFDSADEASRALFKSPGKYTGEMRLVVQALYSQGLPCAYDYKYNICHGIFTATDGSKWVIEISTSGIIAAPLPLNTFLTPEFDWLGYTPAYDPDLFNVTNPDLITLAASTEVADFYSKNPVFNSCGWAFNLDGNEAQNCCTTGSGVGSGIPSTGYRYIINITEVTNEPASATMTLVESELFALQRYSGMKVPSSGETHLEQTYNQDGQDALTDFDAPRYVFYDGNSEKVVRSHGNTAFERQTTDDFYWANDVIGYSTTTHRVWAPTRRTEYSKSSGYNVHTGGYVDRKSFGTTMEGFSLSETTVCSNADLYEWSIGPCSVGVTAQDAVQPWYEIYDLTAYNHENVYGELEEHLSYCIIPIGEREAVYQYQFNSMASTKWASMPKRTVHEGQTCSFKSGETGTCKEVSSLYQASDARFYVDWGNGKVSPGGNYPTPDSDWCLESGLPDGNTGWANGTADGGWHYAELSIVSSGGVSQLIWHDDTIDTGITSYNDDPSPESPQYMLAHVDSTKAASLFCSENMNGVSGSDYYVTGVDTSKYPVSSLNIGRERFFIGEP